MVTDNLTELITVTPAGGGMEIGDWITLAAVLVALGLGISSLVQTQSLQKRERKERLLNEIIEWAIDVSKCGREQPSVFSQALFTDPVTPEKITRSYAVQYDYLSNIQGEASTLIARSEKITNICEKFFHKDLYDKSKVVIDALKKYNQSLSSYSQNLNELVSYYIDTIPHLNYIPAAADQAADMNEVLARQVSEHQQVIRRLTNGFIEKTISLMKEL